MPKQRYNNLLNDFLSSNFDKPAPHYMNGNNNRIANYNKEILIQILPMVGLLRKEFLKHETSSPMLRYIWTEIILLSFFRKRDRDILRSLHIEPVHNDVLHAVAKFHINQSIIRWGGDCSFFLTSKYTRFSNTFPKRHSPKTSGQLKELYQHYHELLHGELGFLIHQTATNLWRYPTCSPNLHICVFLGNGCDSFCTVCQKTWKKNRGEWGNRRKAEPICSCQSFWHTTWICWKRSRMPTFQIFLRITSRMVDSRAKIYTTSMENLYTAHWICHYKSW